MIRGCEKRMIRLRSPESPLFEEVYFILKEEQTSTASMLEEAHRILQEGRRQAECLPSRRSKREWAFFVLGAALSALFAVLLHVLQLI